ncbi:hypothetical protein N7540_011506 [Penicillium herquei]|nr:hypothetical protein N7540_011506 [Penicillium herquei]
MHHYLIEKNFQLFPPSNLTPLTPQILGENHDPEKNRTKATRSLKLQVRNAQEWVKAQKEDVEKRFNARHRSPAAQPRLWLGKPSPLLCNAVITRPPICSFRCPGVRNTEDHLFHKTA